MVSITTTSDQKEESLILNVYRVALPLIFTASLGNILEVVDLSISSFIDIEIVKSIAFLERFRFVYGAILIAFTSTLNMYLNRILPKNELQRAHTVFITIKSLTTKLGLFLALTFTVGLVLFTEKGSPTQIYGIGTGVNIFIMFLSTPWYIALMCSKKNRKYPESHFVCNALQCSVDLDSRQGAGTWNFGSDSSDGFRQHHDLASPSK